MDCVSLGFVPAHPSGMGGIGYAGVGSSLSIISCGQDGKLCIHTPGDLSDKVTKNLQAEGVPCHCLAVNPEQASFAVGDQGHFVKVCSITSKLTWQLPKLIPSTTRLLPPATGCRSTSFQTWTLTASLHVSACLCVHLRIAPVAPIWQLQEMMRASNSSALLKARWQIAHQSAQPADIGFSHGIVYAQYRLTTASASATHALL